MFLTITIKMGRRYGGINLEHFTNYWNYCLHHWSHKKGNKDTIYKNNNCMKTTFRIIIKLITLPIILIGNMITNAQTF